MATNFPGSVDVFTQPSTPTTTALGSAGDGSRAHTAHHRDLGDAVEAMQTLTPSTINVKTYGGAVGDGSADDSAAIQACLDALSATVGGTVYFPKGQYKCLTGLTFTGTKGVRFLGESSAAPTGSVGSLRGSVLIAGTASMTLVTCGVESGTAVHNGPTFEHMHFADIQSGAVTVTSTLVEIKRTCDYTFRNCTFRGGAKGVYINATRASSSDASWGMVDQCFFQANTIGWDVLDFGGAVFVGGRFQDCTTGINIAGGDQNRIIGVKMDGGSNGVVSYGTVHILGSEFESQSVCGVRIGGTVTGGDGKRNRVIGCSFTPDAAVGAIGIWIDSTVREPPVLLGNTYTQNNYIKVQNDSTLGHFRQADGEGTFRLPLAYAPTTTATTLTKFDDLALIDVSGASGSGLNCALPTISANNSFKGRELTIMKTDSSGNVLTLTTPGAETINGANTRTLTTQYAKVTIVFDGTNWIETG